MPPRKLRTRALRHDLGWSFAGIGAVLGICLAASLVLPAYAVTVMAAVLAFGVRELIVRYVVPRDWPDRDDGS